MRPGGVYVCEDIHRRFNGFAAYVQGLSDNLNEFSMRQGTVAPSTFQAAINSIHLYPFVAVIEKCDRPVHEFVAPKHGTQWQPNSFWNSARAVKACGKSAV
jgi:hypothetical protein